MKWICSECKGTNIETKAWVNANTFEYVGLAFDEFPNYCNDCEEHVEFELIDDEDKSQLKLEL